MSIRLKILTGMLLATLGGCGGGSPQSQVYDVVILNGRVMDPEAGYDAVANVGVKDERIASRS
jgi:hypothetical protein